VRKFVGATGEKEGSAAGEGGDGVVDGCGVVSGAVAGSAKVQDVEDRPATAVRDVDGHGGGSGKAGGIGSAGGKGVSAVGERSSGRG